MSYENERASYRVVQRIHEAESVRQLLGRAQVLPPERNATHATTNILQAPNTPAEMPEFILSIDGSYSEQAVKNGYPGASVGYVTVAGVLIDLMRLEQLDAARPIPPTEFRETERASTIDCALPSCNVVTRRQTSPLHSFREELHDIFANAMRDVHDGNRLLDTYHRLLARKPPGSNICPYSEDQTTCRRSLERIAPNVHECDCEAHKPIYSTDALRIHERFYESGSNGEAFGYVMSVWERIMLIHILRDLLRQGLARHLRKIAFFLDGPLAVFGPPAWISVAIKRELQEINAIVQTESGHDLTILGIEKSGQFVEHFHLLDQREDNQGLRFGNRDYMMLTNDYIKARITLNTGDKRYGQDTYFGRKFLYKTAKGAKLVVNMPFLSEAQDTLDTNSADAHHNFSQICGLLDKLVSSRYPNALSPIVTAHSHAAIPLTIGTRVLTDLARVLMRQTT